MLRPCCNYRREYEERRHEILTAVDRILKSGQLILRHTAPVNFRSLVKVQDIFSLPINPHLRDEDVDEVIEVVEAPI
jgi:hypothetical protein